MYFNLKINFITSRIIKTLKNTIRFLIYFLIVFCRIYDWLFNKIIIIILKKKFIKTCQFIFPEQSTISKTKQLRDSCVKFLI